MTLDIENLHIPPENPMPGDTYTDEEGHNWVCSADGLQWLEYTINENGQIETGLTNYDLNRMVVGQLRPKTTNGQLKEYKEILKEFENEAEYFMLLCNDIHYYTVIAHVGGGNNPTFANTVVELLQDNGDIQLIDWQNNEHQAIECWVKNNDGVFMFMLFPYDWGIVECQ